MSRRRRSGILLSFLRGTVSCPRKSLSVRSVWIALLIIHIVIIYVIKTVLNKPLLLT